MKSALDSLIEELQAGPSNVEQVRSGQGSAQAPGPQVSLAKLVLGVSQGASASQVCAWPSTSLDKELRFGHPHAKLFPFIGRKVRTPSGPGTLLQVFAKRVTVLLDSELRRCSAFRPIEVTPVTEEL